MAAGGPGDHPLTDVIEYNLKVYGSEADNLLRKLESLMSSQELWEWWEKEIGWECESEIALFKIKEKLTFAEQRAKESGWEIQ